ncbi:MAG: nucleotidyltransferase family protein, partial [Bacteroidota bacterium]|nr:nucleotidyltransferase family protein [Bacteroidota bacterium]
MRNSQDIIDSYSKELKLLYRLSYESSKISDFEAQTINWEQFYTLAKRHRLIPYLIKNIEKTKAVIPSFLIERLIVANKNNTKRMLKYSAEIIHLAQLLKKNKIAYAFFKGPVLSYELYNDIGIRHSGDIDLIIEKKHISKFNTILLQSNYTRKEPGFALTKKQEKANFSISHHYLYKHKTRNVPIELHWNLTNPGSLFPISTEELLKRKREVPFQDNKIFTLSKTDKLLFLAIHGSIHRWYRLFWLKDFAEISKTITPREWDKLVHKS